MAIADDLDDLFTPKADRDESLSTDGVEDLFDQPHDESLEVGSAEVLFPAKPAARDLLTVPDDIAGSTVAPPDVSTTPISDLLTSLAADLQKLASDIHKLLTDDDSG